MWKRKATLGARGWLRCNYAAASSSSCSDRIEIRLFSSSSRFDSRSSSLRYIIGHRRQRIDVGIDCFVEHLKVNILTCLDKHGAVEKTFVWQKLTEDFDFCYPGQSQRTAEHIFENVWNRGSHRHHHLLLWNNRNSDWLRFVGPAGRKPFYARSLKPDKK